MKTFYAVVTACAMVAMTSCGQCSNKKTAEQSAETSSRAADVPVTMDLIAGYAKLSMHKDSMQTVIASFDSPGGEALYGRLVLPSGSVGNLRFNQITMPDGATDGPFGHEITYDLTGAGTYAMAIGESQMQGDPYSGNFTVELYSGAKVPHEMPAGYFVKNTVDTLAVKSLTITSKKEFDDLFGMATTMKSKPTPIDFSKQFAIAVIGKPTNTGDTYEVGALLRKGDFTTLVYRITKGEKQSYTSRPFLLVAADKQFGGEVRIIEPLGF